MKVVVIGAGFAGLTAAIALQERRHDVLLLERRGVLGGRATSFRDAATGEDVDNGTHLMVGAYTSTLELLRRAGASDLLASQDDLRLDWIDERGVTSLRCPPVAAPLHLAFGLLGLRLPWRARWQALRLGLHVRFGQPPPDATLAEWFARAGQGPEVRRLLWDPLCTAIFNDVPERTAASLFAAVYRDAFLTSRHASRLVFLRCGWGSLCERLGRYFEGRGGRLHRRATVDAVEIEDGRARAVRYTQRAETRDDIRRGQAAAGRRAEADAVVCAVPWGALPALLPEALRGEAPFAGLARLRPAPIVSLDLWLDRPVVDRTMLGLRHGDFEWVFDKGRLFGREGAPQHLAFIISAAFRAHPRPQAELAAAAEDALRRFFPAMREARVLRALVLREAAATFSPEPYTHALRPAAASPVAGLYLAGDWTDTGLPATIEGAVRSGHAAARAVEAPR